MKKFEYHYHSGFLDVGDLNKLGEEGWELCTHKTDEYDTYNEYHFKREIIT